MENAYHLTFKQIAMRIISVVVCGIGVAACVYSLTMQVAEVGAVMASIVWFAGLAAVVASLAGYVVTCDPGKRRGYAPLAAICILVIGAAGVVLEKIYLYDVAVALMALAGLGVEAVLLIIYHYVLKAQDPDAL